MHCMTRWGLVSGLLCMAYTPVFSATPLSLQKTTLQDLQRMVLLQGFQAASSAKKSTMSASRARTPSKDTLQLVEEHKDTNQMIHARMQQQYEGYPVFGGYAIIHSKSPTLIKANTNDVSMNGMIYRDLSSELGQPAPFYQERGQSVLTQWIARIKEGTLSEEVVKPMIYIDEENHAHWAYQVSALVTRPGHIPSRPTAIIDAQTSVPYIEWNDIKTLYALVKGMGYGGNEKIGQYQYGKERPLLDITRNIQTQQCYLDNDHVRIVDMHHRQRDVNRPMSFYCVESYDNTQQENVYWTGLEGTGFNRINGAFSPENDALYIGDVIHQMYHDWYGVNALEKNHQSMKIIMRLHFDYDYENAFWDGYEMTFGDGGPDLYPLVSLTVAAHEISHGFTEQHSGLIYHGQSGAMNESFSDMASQAAEYFVHGACDWEVGEEIIKNHGGLDALRYLDDPTRDGISIASALQYDKNMDVHQTSGVYNHLYYLLSNRPGWNPKIAFQVMIKANMDYWTPFSNFADGACGILSAARDLNYSSDDVKMALDGVAIDYSHC